MACGEEPGVGNEPEFGLSLLRANSGSGAKPRVESIVGGGRTAKVEDLLNSPHPADREAAMTCVCRFPGTSNLVDITTGRVIGIAAGSS